MKKKKWSEMSQEEKKKATKIAIVFIIVVVFIAAFISNETSVPVPKYTITSRKISSAWRKALFDVELEKTMSLDSVKVIAEDIKANFKTTESDFQNKGYTEIEIIDRIRQKANIYMIKYWIKGQKETGIPWAVSNIDVNQDKDWHITSNETLIDLGIPKN